MDPRHFLTCIDRTASLLRKEPGNFKATKAELLVLALDNLPPKRYVIDEAAKKYNVNTLGLVEFLQKYFLY